MKRDTEIDDETTASDRLPSARVRGGQGEAEKGEGQGNQGGRRAHGLANAFPGTFSPPVQAGAQEKNDRHGWRKGTWIRVSHAIAIAARVAYTITITITFTVTVAIPLAGARAGRSPA
ncbi:hypothetical protein UCDDA912_g04744 [Diaporthe ampelina]|uniref:Uncharacterized protein n=1 Tax=Diaporthe ampelina TaxID=1214573 RepID=A0A0G2FMN6_9PEZI|nr:hypothetical protein UCDDA912_g04744 [Diaporthe ampelina]